MRRTGEKARSEKSVTSFLLSLSSSLSFSIPGYLSREVEGILSRCATMLVFNT